MHRTRLLPQQSAPVDQKQIALTARHLRPLGRALPDYLLALRRQLDMDLAPKCPPALGKHYPLGRCTEITGAAVTALSTRIQAPKHPVEAALARFIVEGGIVKPIWGALRGLYFQNAMQFGSLYVDVANDTVTVTKPKVEILPLAQSGLEMIRDAGHFAEIAGRYWGANLYANVTVPALAPLFPLISVIPGTYPTLESASDYMLELFMVSGFEAALPWLETAPAPPEPVLQALGRLVPPDLLEADPAAGRAAALAACATNRARGLALDRAWRDARVQDYLRVRRKP